MVEQLHYIQDLIVNDDYKFRVRTCLKPITASTIPFSCKMSIGDLETAKTKDRNARILTYLLNLLLSVILQEHIMIVRATSKTSGRI